MALPRGMLIVPLMLLTALVVATTTQSAVRSAPPAAPAGMDPAHPCKQYPYPGGVVKDPPIAPNPHDITLYAFQDGQRYCYRQNTTDAYYYEAPTILVQNHDYFNITLHNRLNLPAGHEDHGAMGAGATPQPQGDPPCPVLDQMLPPHAMSPTSLTFTPPPKRSPFPFSPVVTYLNHQRSVDPAFPHPDAAGTMEPSPPPHLGDTNLHFHGLDTDPLEDNVFRSTNAAPNRTCKFHIPLYANQAAGTYWYHTHMHHISEGQVSGGLAGSLIILPNLLGGNANTPLTARNFGRVLLVKDLVPAGQTDEARQKEALLLRRANAAAGASPTAPATTAVFTPVPNVNPANPPPWYTPTGNNLDPGDPLSKDCLGGGAPVPGATTQPTFQAMQVDGVPIYVKANPDGRGTTQSSPEPNTRHAASHDERYRIIDASANAYLDIELFDVNGKTRTRKPLIVMARDGVDVSSSSAVHRSSVLIPPGGRLDIDVQDAKNDQVIVAAASHPQRTNPDGSVDGAFCPGNNGDYEPSRDLLVIHPSSGAAAVHAAAVPAQHVAGANEKTDADRLVQSALHLSSAANAKKSVTSAARANTLLPHRVITFQQYWDGFYVTETSGDDPFHPKSDFVERPFELVKPPPGSHDTYVIPTIHVHRPKLKGPNDKYIEYWTLVNAATQIHAFHIHQLTFVTLNNTADPGQHYVFEDTTPLLPGMPCVKAKNETALDAKCVPRFGLTGTDFNDVKDTPWVLPTKTELLIDFSKVPVGRWVFHCHMLNHEDKGMMGIIQVD